MMYKSNDILAEGIHNLLTSSRKELHECKGMRLVSHARHTAFLEVAVEEVPQLRELLSLVRKALCEFFLLHERCLSTHEFSTTRVLMGAGVVAVLPVTELLHGDYADITLTVTSENIKGVESSLLVLTIENQTRQNNGNLCVEVTDTLSA